MAKVANVQAPFFFKWAVDELGQSGVPEAVASESVAMLASTGALLVGCECFSRAVSFRLSPLCSNFARPRFLHIVH